MAAFEKENSHSINGAVIDWPIRPFYASFLLDHEYTKYIYSFCFLKLVEKSLDVLLKSEENIIIEKVRQRKIEVCKVRIWIIFLYHFLQKKYILNAGYFWKLDMPI